MGVKFGNVNISHIAGVNKIYHGIELILFKSYEDYTKDELLKIYEERFVLYRTLVDNKKVQAVSDWGFAMEKYIAVYSVITNPELYDKSDVIERFKEMNAEIERLQAYIAGEGK